MSDEPTFSDADATNFAHSMGIPAEGDPPSSIYNLLAVKAEENGTDSVTITGTAVKWNADTGDAIAVDHGGQDMAAFIDTVRSDMENLIAGTLETMLERHKNGVPDANIYVDLMSGLINTPVEVVYNMFATAMLALMEETEDDNGDEKPFSG